MVSMLKTARVRRFAAGGLAGAVLLAVLPAGAGAQESTSEPLAMELAELMSSAQLDAVAGADASEENRFVAALAFPGQLLVVSARYEVPVYITDRIAARQFRDIYIDLNSRSMAGTKVLVTDSGANGLHATGDTVDMVDDGSGIFRLDGEWRDKDMSRSEYEAGRRGGGRPVCTDAERADRRGEPVARPLNGGQGEHSAPRRERRGAMGSPQADAGGLGRSPI